MIYKNYFLPFLLLISYGGLFAQPCSSEQVLSSTQQSVLQGLLPVLDAALALESKTKIDSLSHVLKSIYGEEAGKPEKSETYIGLSNSSTWLSAPEVLSLSRLLIGKDSAVYADLWKMAKGMAPPLYQPNSIFLRTSAETAAGLLKIASVETDQQRKQRYTFWAMRALDSLATQQLSSGAFPFPDLRVYQDPVFSPIIQKFLLSCGDDSVLVLQNGWIMDDKGSGEFKFDAGVIANAYYEAYLLTGKQDYRQRVISIAEYVLSLSWNRNYNYNTFASLALTRAFQLGADDEYLERAASTLRYSVRPGQLSNGRWMDGHNAQSRYHSIMIQNAVPTIQELSDADPYLPALDTMIRRAIKNMNDYTLECGAATGYRWLLKAIELPVSILPSTLRDSCEALIGRYLNRSASHGNYFDVPTAGEYLLIAQELNGLDEKLSPESMWEVYPNPAQEEISIHGSLPLGPCQVRIYDVQGRCWKEDFFSHLSESSPPISLQNLPTGIYYIHIRSEGFHQTVKCVKVN
ncbi:MAG: T9SS type A sorting domain-containing protein [Cytophagaceae bacterium]|jgi:hypothetical protein|nr:T9SS type A sorting domain-containing protein [Cytophagaceae bacterium]